MNNETYIPWAIVAFLACQQGWFAEGGSLYYVGIIFAVAGAAWFGFWLLVLVFAGLFNVLKYVRGEVRCRR